MTTSLLRITDGTTVLNFSTGNNMKLMKYKPVTVVDFEKYIEEEFNIDLVSTIATNRANINIINRLFQQARNYFDSESGPKVYLEFDPGSSGTYWRSQLKNGRIELGENTIGFEWEIQRFRLTIHVTRQPFWEGALTQLPLTNASATNNTSGITVTNSYDSTAENFVDINDSDVLGDLPVPIKVEVEHTKNGAAAAKEFYIWHNVYSNPATLDHILEGEDATGSTVTDSGADTTSSNDQYATLAWTATVETLIAEWELAEALVNAAAGGRFAILARWRGTFPYTNAWIRLKMLTSTGNILWNGNLSIISSSRELALLDVLRIPPYLAGQSSIKAIVLRIYGYRNQSGTHSIPLDYLQLSPISGDSGWKRFLAVDDGFGYQEKLVHDDVEGFDYRVDTSSKIISDFSTYGGPILLVPNHDQRLYFNSCDKDNLAKVDQTFKVKLWYRPRRNSL